MKIAVISDTHAQWSKLKVPECDLLISTGDYSGYQGNEGEFRFFHKWLNKQPAKHIVSCQGNHEVWVQNNLDKAREIAAEVAPRVHFMVEGGLEIEGIKIWCSPVTPMFYNWAWNVNPGAAIQAYWKLIPDDTEILVTHGPPAGILDTCEPDGIPLGCPSLRERIRELNHLKLHVFGHIHSSSGSCEKDGIRFINASVCNERYEPVNGVKIYDFPAPARPGPLPRGRSLTQG
ncbi:MAG: metallophosphatase domain-containing protein [Alphaproteobacteria bacterium]|nr:metallophosphatase domain-containing protein [Alphaproteobacteria bacterium]